MISDTHIPDRHDSLPRRIAEEIQMSDAVIHCGDFTSEEFCQELMGFGKPLYAVHGNMDDYRIIRRFPSKQVVKLEGHSIGITHGEGMPRGIEERVKRVFYDEEIEFLLFGHTHEVLWQEGSRPKLLNPGSATDRYPFHRPSYALLTIKSEGVQVAIVYY